MFLKGQPFAINLRHSVCVNGRRGIALCLMGIVIGALGAFPRLMTLSFYVVVLAKLLRIIFFGALANF